MFGYRTGTETSTETPSDWRRVKRLIVEYTVNSCLAHVLNESRSLFRNSEPQMIEVSDMFAGRWHDWSKNPMPVCPIREVYLVLIPYLNTA